MSPDVKVYQAYVEIDEDVQYLKLKPGLSAVATIFTETKAEKVLAGASASDFEPAGEGREAALLRVTARALRSRAKSSWE